MFHFWVRVKPTRQQDTARVSFFFSLKASLLSRKHGRPRVDQPAVMRWIISNPSRASIVWRQLNKQNIKRAMCCFFMNVTLSGKHG